MVLSFDVKGLCFDCIGEGLMNLYGTRCVAFKVPTQAIILYQGEGEHRLADKDLESFWGVSKSAFKSF